MDLLKKHYEKFLLGVVLVGLVVAVAWLPFKIAADKQELEDKRVKMTPKVKLLTNLDLTMPELALKRVTAPALIDFSAPNRLCNPMPWQKTPDGIRPATKLGPTAATITNITPLYLKLTLDGVVTVAEGAKYVIGVEKQAAPSPQQRSKKQTYCKLNDKNDTFTLIEVRGKPEEPSQLVLHLNDTGERAVISKDVPFRRVEGYMADIRYDPDKKVWAGRRVNSLPAIAFNGEEYNIVAINKDEVVLSAKSNQKKWTIKQSANASP
jgi:hypothetical protein